MSEFDIFEIMRDLFLKNGAQEIDLGLLVQDGESVSLQHKESKMTDEQAQDVAEGMLEWSAEFDNYINNPPKEGDILTAAGTNANALLIVELKENQHPFIYGRAYVPEIVGLPLGWFLQDTNSPNSPGWKCILLPRARTELIRQLGLRREPMEVKSLKVIRYSQSKQSILCEVHEYVDEEVRSEPEPIQAAVPENEVPLPAQAPSPYRDLDPPEIDENLKPEPAAVDPEYPAV